jgi:CRP-like cAMP-binding protein
MVKVQRTEDASRNLHVRGKNRLLTLIEASGHVVDGLERVTLKKKASLHKPDVAITHAFFPLSGVASLITSVGDGDALEVGTMGNEAIVGIPLLLGADRTHTEAFVQIEGEFMRMTREAVEQELRSNSPFGEITRRYAQAFFTQATQSAACLRFHHIDQRLCRWILESHDRVGKDEVPLTQEFLALMLGVHRPGVTLAAAQLQKAGFISYRRGCVEVLDRQGLEASCCDCYGIIRKEFERLLC